MCLKCPPFHLLTHEKLLYLQQFWQQCPHHITSPVDDKCVAYKSFSNSPTHITACPGTFQRYVIVWEKLRIPPLICQSRPDDLSSSFQPFTWSLACKPSDPALQHTVIAPRTFYHILAGMSSSLLPFGGPLQISDSLATLPSCLLLFCLPSSKVLVIPFVLRCLHISAYATEDSHQLSALSFWPHLINFLSPCCWCSLLLVSYM